MFTLSRFTAIFSVLLFLCSTTIFAQEDSRPGVTPMRLSYIEGDVSFWRDGAPDWVDAQLNIPFAAGDSLYVGSDGNLELQMGNRAFVRADDETQLTLVNQTADFVQFKITSGRATFDLRALNTGNSVELDTPNAVFTIDHAGYYRLDVDDDVHFITRRGGRAMVIPAGGQAMSINPSEEIVVSGTSVAQAVTYVAPEIDGWDRWNYDRTEDLLDAVSERYLPYDVAGASDLDNYGNWRVVADYGPIWIPDGVPPGWAPYSTGSWGWDPYYQWTWIDDEPWGWAPFHYGRWVYLGGYWAWAPGPVIRHPVYAPALVAFFDFDGDDPPGMGWVALGWGEPLTPWWGQPDFIGRAWWGGWGGPRVVNNKIIHDHEHVDMRHARYNNTHVRDAVVTTPQAHFGNGRVRDKHASAPQTGELKHVSGALPVKPRPESLVAGARHGASPPESMLSRPVIATRPPRESKLPWRIETSRPELVQQRNFVLVPKHTASDLPRPAFGGQTGAERNRPPVPPHFQGNPLDAGTGNVRHGNADTGRTSPLMEPGVSRSATPQPAATQRQSREPAARRDVPMQNPDLPGNPANRVFQNERSIRDMGNDNANGNPQDDQRRSRQRPDGY